MRIENLKLEHDNGMACVSANIIWEDCPEKNRVIHFLTRDEFSNGLVCNPDAFAVGCFLPAMFRGEKRLKIDGGICPSIRQGLITNMAWYSYWHKGQYKPLILEAPISTKAYSSAVAKGSGLFLSGGVDSLYSLRQNRLNFPLDHSASIRDCFLVHGFDIHPDEATDKKMETFDRAIYTLKAVAEDARINLIPVYTNIRHLCSDLDFWMHWYFGSALSSVAHSFAGRLNQVTIASAGGPSDIIQPWGSHPAADPYYSSSYLNIRYDYLCERFEKIRVIADWDVALQNMRVCTYNAEGYLNCGRCEKCIRTMLSLLVLRRLDRSKAFPTTDISPILLRNVVIDDRNKYIIRYYEPLLKPLEDMDRKDLSDVLKKEFGVMGALRRFDRKYLNRLLVRIWSLVRKIFLRRNQGV